jgi:alkyl hydroperoxide reductase subunit AhpF
LIDPALFEPLIDSPSSVALAACRPGPRNGLEAAERFGGQVLEDLI